MNLFRSEEHARRWRRFDSRSLDGIVPVVRLHERVFSRVRRFRERLAPDYLLRLTELAEGMPDAIASLKEGSDFWKPRRSQ